MLTDNVDEYGGQTVPEKVAEQLHGQPTVIVKLTPTSVAPDLLTKAVSRAMFVELMRLLREYSRSGQSCPS